MREVPGRPQDLCGGLLGSGDILQGTEADLRVALAVRAEIGAVPDPPPGAGPDHLDRVPGGKGFAGVWAQADVNYPPLTQGASCFIPPPSGAGPQALRRVPRLLVRSV